MSCKEPLISVILPVKNGDLSLLKRALSSVRNQSCSNYEILMIDDASEKSYAEKLESLAAEDPRIRLLSIPASGVSGARNFAIGQAEGDILTFLDSDDALQRFCFEEAVTLLEESDADILWGGTFYGSSEEIENRLQEDSGKTARSKEELRSLSIELTEDRLHKSRAEAIGEPFRFEDQGYINRGIAARFIRRECFADGKMRFPSGIKMYEDTIWNLKQLEEQKILYVKAIWYYYLENEASASNSYHEDAAERMEIPLSMIRQILDLSDPEEYTAYTRLLIDSLRYVYKCLYGNPEWKASAGERKKLKDHLYTEEPWSEIASGRFREAADPRDQKKALLYRLRLLFLYWKLTWNRS